MFTLAPIFRLTRAPFAVVVAGTLLGCGGHREPTRAAYVPLPEVERTYGRLITAGNHPAPHQSGTGERVGLFQEANGDVWGLPLAIASDGAVLACAPAALRKARTTDLYPAGGVIIGATNEPTGWRGGAGGLELLVRDAGGVVRWQTVRGSQLETGPACWAPELPGPPQRLDYYRLSPGPR